MITFLANLKSLRTRSLYANSAEVVALAEENVFGPPAGGNVNYNESGSVVVAVSAAGLAKLAAVASGASVVVTSGTGTARVNAIGSGSGASASSGTGAASVNLVGSGSGAATCTGTGSGLIGLTAAGSSVSLTVGAGVGQLSLWVSGDVNCVVTCTGTESVSSSQAPTAMQSVGSRRRPERDPEADRAFWIATQNAEDLEVVHVLAHLLGRL